MISKLEDKKILSTRHLFFNVGAREFSVTVKKQKNGKLKLVKMWEHLNYGSTHRMQRVPKSPFRARVLADLKRKWKP